MRYNRKPEAPEGASCISTTIVYAMRIVLPVLVVLLISAVILSVHESGTPASDDPDLSLAVYGACTEDADCVLVPLSCGSVGAVRKDRQTEIRHYYAATQGHRRCPSHREPVQDARAACAAARCTVQMKNGEE
jgi:hypothetical protein